MASKTVRITLTLPDGTRKYYSGKTRKEAEEKRDRDKCRLMAGQVVGDRTTFDELTQQWFLAQKKDELHARSIDTINGIFKRYISPFLGSRQVSTIKPLDIQNLMRTVSDLSYSTQKKVLGYTKSVLTLAVDNGLLPRNPCTSTIKAGGAKPEEAVPLTKDECRNLIDSVKGTRAYPFIMVLLYTGVRKGEALGLMWKDIDFGANTISISRTIVYPNGNKAGEINTEMKTKNAKRTIPMAAPLKQALLEHKKDNKSVYVFSMQNGKFLSESSFRKMWDVVNRRVPGVHPHLLRHTCVTNWIAAGLQVDEVQHLAGHATPDITLNIYTHYVESDRLAATAAKMQGIL